MFVNSTVLALGALILGAGLLLQRVLLSRRYPATPGPKLAVWTHLWYMWKVWQGNFETWEIEAHISQGKIVRVTPDMYSIDDPGAVKTIYGVTKPMQKSRWYKVWGPYEDHNLFNATTPSIHADMRRKVASLYSMTAIKHYEPYVETCISLVLGSFDRFAASGETFDLAHWMRCYAFDVIGEITYGKRYGFLESGGRDIDGTMKSIDGTNSFCTMLAIDKRFLPFWLAVAGGNPFSGMGKYLNTLHEAWENSERDEGSAQTFKDKTEAIRKESPEDYEKYRVEGTITANFGAGSDTTSISLTAILSNLLKNKETYVKLRNETWSASEKGEIDEPITFSQAQNLPYLQFVIKEALRAHPATGLPMWREVPREGVTVAGQFFVGGAIIGINSWVAHMNTSVFGDDAAEFRPDRWNPEYTPKDQLAKMEQYYLPFGAGVRTCIRKNISILEMSKLIPELVRRYDFELLGRELKCTNRCFVRQESVEVRITSRSITNG